MNIHKIVSKVKRSLENGKSTEEVFEEFIYECMFADRNPNPTIRQQRPSPSSVWKKLMGNAIFNQDDISLKRMKVMSDVYDMELDVKIHPSLSLTILNYDGLKVTVNGCSKVKNWLGHLSPEDTAQWMILMKQNMPEHMKEWDEILNIVLKTLKGQRLAMIAIKAIIVDAMKDYSIVRYSVKAQKDRARIDIMITENNCKTIYAYWSTYRKKLPDRIEEVKVLIDKYSNPA